MEEIKVNIPLALELLEKMDRQLEEIQKGLREMRATIDAPAKFDTTNNTWSEEEEAQYRMRHAS